MKESTHSTQDGKEGRIQWDGQQEEWQAAMKYNLTSTKYLEEKKYHPQEMNQMEQNAFSHLLFAFPLISFSFSFISFHFMRIALDSSLSLLDRAFYALVGLACVSFRACFSFFFPSFTPELHLMSLLCTLH
jgi:hypothetical protein